MRYETTDIPLEVGIAAMISSGIFFLIISGCAFFFWLGLQRMLRFWVTDPVAKEMSFSQYVASFITGVMFKSQRGSDYFAARNFYSWSFFSFVVGFLYLFSIHQTFYTFLVDYFGRVFNAS